VGLLPRHGNSHGFLRRHEMINAYSILANGELHAFDDAVELVSTRPVVLRDRGPWDRRPRCDYCRPIAAANTFSALTRWSEFSAPAPICSAIPLIVPLNELPFQP
jgi:hypothetical protein